LVQWEKGGAEAATWEDEAILKEQFLEFNLEDKVVSEKGKIVRQEHQNRDKV